MKMADIFNCLEVDGMSLYWERIVVGKEELDKLKKFDEDEKWAYYCNKEGNIARIQERQEPLGIGKQRENKYRLDYIAEELCYRSRICLDDLKAHKLVK